MSFWKNIQNTLNGFSRNLSYMWQGFKQNTPLGRLYDMSSSGALLESATGKYLGTNLTGAEREANAFNAEEAQKQRDWEEYMASTVKQREVADYKKAGINPMMAAGGSGTVPSGASASSVSPSVGSLSDLFSLAMLKPEIELKKAQAENLRSQARNRDLLTPEQINKIKQDMKESDARIDELAAREQKEYSDIDVNIAKSAALWSESNLYDVEADKYVALTDSQIKLNEARGKESESQASLNFMNALYQSKLVQADMPEKVAAKVVAETAQAYKNASVAEQEAARKEIENSIKTGTWTKTHSNEGTFWDKCVMHFDRATSLLGNILSLHN